MKITPWLWCALIPACLFAADDPPHPFVGAIERLDPAFDRLVAPGAKIEKLAEGFRWSEGPTWYDGGVVFSDVLANTAYRWKPGATAQAKVGAVSGAEVFLKPSRQLRPGAGFRGPGRNGCTGGGRGPLSGGARCVAARPPGGPPRLLGGRRRSRGASPGSRTTAGRSGPASATTRPGRRHLPDQGSWAPSRQRAP